MVIGPLLILSRFPAPLPAGLPVCRDQFKADTTWEDTPALRHLAVNPLARTLGEAVGEDPDVKGRTGLLYPIFFE
ncbi:hypothetical protein OB2597_05375 [Pseudooceanicola batsensis HTCC2597]|uniref:Uncharacterized protein n=1 Tax=Pseudooceanicola batsensis (strain ATCC BAA-863 / DSM 15984 / KCTC 12145 / HTCC2597) TaxID=252305 RepID=A3TSR0_PSEBH|nr:hypothetical protein OB2597_05375 [Pseudooceanicola batsensis HTCC2597]